jgi:hypothetical protein
MFRTRRSALALSALLFAVLALLAAPVLIFGYPAVARSLAIPGQRGAVSTGPPGLLEGRETFDFKDRRLGFRYRYPSGWSVTQTGFGVHLQNGGPSGDALPSGEAAIAVDLMFEPQGQLTTLETLASEIRADPAVRIAKQYTRTVGGEPGEAFVLSGGLARDYTLVFTTQHEGLLFRAWAQIAAPAGAGDAADAEPLAAAIAQLESVLDSLAFSD